MNIQAKQVMSGINYGTIYIFKSDKARIIASKTLEMDSEIPLSTFNGDEVRDIDLKFEPKIEGGQHLNINVMDRDMLLDAQVNPEKYPQLTIRVSGYATRFNALTKEQQDDVISRTFTTKF